MLDARRGDDCALVEVQRQLGTGRTGVEGDVVDADAGLLDRAVVGGADQLAVLGDPQFEDGLGRVRTRELAGGEGAAAEGDDEGGHGDRERWGEQVSDGAHCGLLRIGGYEARRSPPESASGGISRASVEKSPLRRHDPK